MRRGKRSRLPPAFEGTSVFVLALGAAVLAVAGAGAILLPAAPALGQWPWVYHAYRDPASAPYSYQGETLAQTLLRLGAELSEGGCNEGPGCRR